jgi:pimeloyl-ACP methyl ester carboxylesterase
VRRSLPAVAALAAVLLMPAGAHAALRFKECGGYGFGCARTSVPLDHSGAVKGSVSLYVKRVRANKKPRKGALFVLAGGPGQSATDAFDGDVLGQLSVAYRRRDLIVYDQRGTGRSGILRCRGLARVIARGPGAPGCANRIGPRRAFYSTSDSVEDMEDIRQRLGLAKIAIFGTSYGTKVALAYAARYPGNVERLVLDSVVAGDGPDPLYRSSFEAAPRALRALCRKGCRAVTPDPVADLRTLLARLAVAPLRGRLVSSRGRVRKAGFTHADLFVVLIAGDLDPALRSGFPGAVRSALNGDPAPIIRLKKRALLVDAEPPPPREISTAVYAATSCLDTPFQWSPAAAPADRMRQAEAAAAQVADADFAPFDRRTALESDLFALCRAWPGSPGPQPATGPLPDVPVLIFEGEDDLRTPLEDAQRVAARFPRAKLLLAPNTGHSALGSAPGRCLGLAFDRFFAGGKLPVAPRSLGELRPVAGLAGARGRVLRALALTLDDVNDDSLASIIANESDPDLARGGGLRGGRYRLGVGGTLVLERVQYVPGVRISGRVRNFGERNQRGRLRVTGHGPSARLVLRGTRISGRVGGKRVSGRLRRTSTAATAAAARLTAN